MLNDLRKYGAVAILAVIGLGVLNFLGRQVILNAQDISVIKERDKTNRQMLIEIKQDVHWIRERLYREERNGRN